MKEIFTQKEWKEMEEMQERAERKRAEQKTVIKKLRLKKAIKQELETLILDMFGILAFGGLVYFIILLDLILHH